MAGNGCSRPGLRRTPPVARSPPGHPTPPRRSCAERPDGYVCPRRQGRFGPCSVTLSERIHLAHPTRDDRQRALSGLIRRIGVTDLLLIIWAIMGAQLIRFGQSAAQATLSAQRGAAIDLGYTL